MVDLYRYGTIGVFVNRVDVSNYVRNLRWKLAKNEIPNVEIKLDRYADALIDVDINNRIAVTYNDILLGTGILEKPETTSKKDMDLTIRLIGNDGTNLARSTVSKYEYIETSQDTIIKKLLTSDNSGTANWILNPGTVDTRGVATVRVENKDRLTPIMKVCEDMGLWAEFTHPKPAVSTVDSYDTTNYSAVVPLDDTVSARGQSFTCSTDTTLDSCKFYLYKTNSPTGYAYAKLYAHDGTYGSTGVPLGTALATSSTALDVSTLTGGPLLYTFSFANQLRKLEAGKKYVIALEYTSGTAADIVQVGQDSTPLHTGNSSYYTTGTGVWTASSPTRDLIFYVYGSDDYHEVDRFNAWDWEDATKYPAKNSSSFTFTPGNTTKITKKLDLTRCINHIRLLGAVQGTRQLESICYHATDNRSRLKYGLDCLLASDITATQTNITVNDNTGFATSGTIEIDNESITYTGKTGSTIFTGCTRSATDGAIHKANTGVINKSPTYIYVDDNTNFPASGSVWIGLEKISYTTKTSTDRLSGTITRGVAWGGSVLNPGQRKYYAHGIDAPVWDAQYTETAPEAGSSLAVYGFQGAIQTDKTIIDQNALDVAAGITIENFNTPPEVITIEGPPSLIDSVWLGDTVTISDANYSGTDDDYRVYALELTDGPGVTGKLIITCGNEKVSFTKDQAEQRQELSNLSVYAQGIPNIYCISASENVDGVLPVVPATTHPMYLNFFLPPTAIAVKSVDLSYNLKNYRADSTSTVAAPLTRCAYNSWNNNALNSAHFGLNDIYDGVVVDPIGLRTSRSYYYGGTINTGNFARSTATVSSSATVCNLPTTLVAMSASTTGPQIGGAPAHTHNSGTAGWRLGGYLNSVIPPWSTSGTWSGVTNVLSNPTAGTSGCLVSPSAYLVDGFAPPIQGYGWAATVFAAADSDSPIDRTNPTLNSLYPFDRTDIFMSIVNDWGVAKAATGTLQWSGDGVTWTTLATYTTWDIGPLSISIGNPCVISLTNHGLATPNSIKFSTTGTLPTGIVAGTTYYVRFIDVNTFHIYDTSAHALAGGATGRIITSGSQSGIQKGASDTVPNGAIVKNWYTDTNSAHETGTYKFSVPGWGTLPAEADKTTANFSQLNIHVTNYTRHTAPLTYGIYENTTELHSATSTYVNVSVGTGGKLDAVGTYQGNQQGLSIVPTTFYWEPNNWYYVKLDTAHANNAAFGGRARIEANLYPTIYIT